MKSPRYLIKYPQSIGVNGKVIETWSNLDRIRIDTVYYREEKIKKLINEQNTKNNT